ncbi:MAG: ATP synthase F1 subunit gamma [Planctomycetes bacterium]|nr:ATP synthase F1 subunit gamma [Planctomycetota bacterium]
MATLRDIRRRIHSTKNTQQITRAMKMIAAARLRKVQNRLVAVRPYTDALGRVVRRMLEEAAEDQHPLLRTREVRTTALTFFSGDRGLCGAYNGNVLRATQSFLQKNQARNPKLIAIGKKGVDYIRRHSIETLETHAHIAEEITFRGVARMARKMAQYYLEGTVDEMHLIYTSFVSTFRHPVVQRKLLPIDMDALPEMKGQEDGPSTHMVIYEPSYDDALGRLLNSYLSAALYEAFMESLTSEYASRMTAMDAATENAEDMIAHLTMDYNRARQRAITFEILDIVGGAEALK